MWRKAGYETRNGTTNDSGTAEAKRPDLALRLDVVVHASDMTCMVKALLIERAKAIPIKFSCCLLLCHGVPVYDRAPPIFAWLHAADGSSSTPSPYAIPPRLV